MATTQIADLIVPQIYHNYQLERTAQSSYLWSSGIIRNDAKISEFLAGGGATFNVPFVKPVVQDASNAGNDDPASTATPKKLTAGNQTGVRLTRNQGWEVAELAKIFSGVDPVAAALDETGLGQYWANEYQAHLIATLTGIQLDNTANDAGDMVYTAGVAGTAAAGAPANADIVTPTTVAAAENKKGDRSGMLNILICHPDIAASLKVQMLSLTGQGVPQANNVQLQNQQWGFSPYLNKLVVLDDNCPKVADGGSRFLYTSYLCGQGVAGFGSTPHPKPLTSDFMNNQGNGEGVSQIWSRQIFCIHPYGFRFTSTTITAPAKTPTVANLALAANWDRVMQPKNIPLVFMRTNG